MVLVLAQYSYFKLELHMDGSRSRSYFILTDLSEALGGINNLETHLSFNHGLRNVTFFLTNPAIELLLC